MRLYECSVRFDKMMQNGVVKKVTEKYLVDAVLFSEAEARIYREMAPYISGEFDVVAIKRTKYSEIVYDKFNLLSQAESEFQKITRQNSQLSELADKWFEVVVNFITIDEKTAAEKKTATAFIVNANSNKTAHEAVVEHMKGTISDYEIATVKETSILEVYVYSADGSQSVGVKEGNNKQTASAVIEKYYDSVKSRQEVEKEIAESPEIKKHVQGFVDACADGGIESVTMTASDGKTTKSATISIPQKGKDAIPKDDNG